jgi:SAM-dependent methyltransferase
MSAFSATELAGWYDTMVDWSKRLSHETPFFRRWFSEAHAQRVLDIACGSGHHAALFHQWGLVVEGADLSHAMLELARHRHGTAPGLTWTCRGFTDPLPTPCRFDVTLCVGNSLALAPDLPAARQAVGRMLEATRPGGIILVQVANLWRLPDGPCIWQKAVPLPCDAGTGIILKGLHRHGNTGYVDWVVSRQKPGPELHSESIRWWGLEVQSLTRWLMEADAEVLGVFGGYQDEPYEPVTSVDLVVVARKGTARRPSAWNNHLNAS